MPPESITLDSTLVRRLIARQFPQWTDLPIRPVARGGWDNRTFHLGSGMSVRLPSAQCYAAQVEKEQRWLPKLARCVPLPIPIPVAMGEPGDGYPWRWSIYRWLAGEPAATAAITDASACATVLGMFLLALQRADASGGPEPGRHNFFRGGPLATYDLETRQAIAILGDAIDGRTATAAWDAALATRWDRQAVWVHGDVAAGNLLVADGTLAAVIDFGCCGIGDPACDLAIAWTWFSGSSRAAFRRALEFDGPTWARARGWTLWKALITLADRTGADAAAREHAHRIIGDVLAEHRATS